MNFATLLVILISLGKSVNAWDDVDLEIFDLVEEINENFYQMLGVQQVKNIVFSNWNF